MKRSKKAYEIVSPNYLCMTIGNARGFDEGKEE